MNAAYLRSRKMPSTHIAPDDFVPQANRGSTAPTAVRAAPGSCLLPPFDSGVGAVSVLPLPLNGPGFDFGSPGNALDFAAVSAGHPIIAELA